MFDVVKPLKLQILAIPEGAVRVSLRQMSQETGPSWLRRPSTKMFIADIRNKPIVYYLQGARYLRASFAQHLVLTAENGLPPFRIVQIPGDGFSDATIKGFCRPQPNSLPDFASWMA